MKLILSVCMFFFFVFLSCFQTPSFSSTAVPESPSMKEGAEVKPIQGQVVNPPGADQIRQDVPKEQEQQSADTQKNSTDEEKEVGEETLQIADPILPWNKAMYHVNDKLYFWLMKPLAQGYSAVAPEDIRLAVSNFFHNLTTPVRFVSSLLQFKIKEAGNELIRFVYNSTAGVGGLADVAKTDLDIKRHDEDLGQTLGTYGIGQGFYIVWPFLGPSSLRDTIGMVGDFFLDPVHYVNPTETAVGITMYDKVNETSLYIGDYEDLKKSAIDPYISIRDAYIQHRKKKVEE
jgi:phospholipid-binding lipoprotein MlaA